MAAVLSDTQVDPEVIDELHTSRMQLGDVAPRFGLFLFACATPEAIRATPERIPQALDPWLAEVVVMLESPASCSITSSSSGTIASTEPRRRRSRRGFQAQRMSVTQSFFRSWTASSIAWSILRPARSTGPSSPCRMRSTKRARPP